MTNDRPTETEPAEGAAFPNTLQAQCQPEAGASLLMHIHMHIHVYVHVDVDVDAGLPTVTPAACIPA